MRERHVFRRRGLIRMALLIMLISFFMTSTVWGAQWPKDVAVTSPLSSWVTRRSGEKKMPPVFDMEKCSGCGTCDDICPADAIHMKTSGDVDVPYLKYPEECWHCGSCRQDCPEEAIEIQFPPDMLSI